MGKKGEVQVSGTHMGVVIDARGRPLKLPDDEKIRQAAKEFRGVKRRFEYIIPPALSTEQEGFPVFIDDYAHHPEELRALIKGVRNLFPDWKCTVVFQPHLYSRTRDLSDGFAEVLDMADDVILLPIYPAREKEIGGVSSEMILKKMKSENKTVMEKKDLLKWMDEQYKAIVKKTKEKNILVTAGAGDIDMIIEPIKEILTKK